MATDLVIAWYLALPIAVEKPIVTDARHEVNRVPVILKGSDSGNTALTQRRIILVVAVVVSTTSHGTSRMVAKIARKGTKAGFLGSAPPAHFTPRIQLPRHVSSLGFVELAAFGSDQGLSSEG